MASKEEEISRTSDGEKAVIKKYLSIKIILRIATGAGLLAVLLRVTGCDVIYSPETVSMISSQAKAKLDRWPLTWQEALDTVKPGHTYGKVSDVEYAPIDENKCRVRITGLNIFFWSVTDTHVIEYHPESLSYKEAIEKQRRDAARSGQNSGEK